MRNFTLGAVLIISGIILPFSAFATPVSWDKTTNLLQPLPTSYSDEVRVPYLTATSSTATTTLKKTTITGAISILGEYFTNFTTYVRSLFSNGTGLDYSGGAFSLANTAVTPGAYTNANLTIDQQGRITLASSGSSGSGTISTSTVPTVGQLPYWTSNGYPSLLGSVATGTVSSGTGISVTTGQSIIGSGLTITNTAPDQTVVLSNGAGISTSGTYPNFTITNTAPQTFSYPFPSNATTTNITFSNGLTGNLTGNADTATKFATARAINGVNFDGSAPITITAASSTLLSDTNTWANTQGMSISGNAATVTTNANLLGVVTSVGNTTSFGSQTAGVLGNAATGNTAPMATSTLYGTGVGGQVLAWDNNTGGLAFMATSSSSGTNYFTNSGAYTTLSTGYKLAVPTNGEFDIGTNLFAYATTTNLSTIVGLYAGGQNATTSPTAYYTTAFGYQALTANTTGANNVGIGAGALFANTTGSHNTALGFQAFTNSNTGSDNTIVGYQAGDAGSGAYQRNSLFGVSTNYNASSVLYDTSEFGYRAGYNNTGWDSTFLGTQAGQNNTSGNNNIAIGFNTLMPSATASNQLNIGNIIFGTGLAATSSSASVIPTQTGNIGIASTSPWAQFSINPIAGVSTAFAIGSSTANLLTVSSTGNLAIGGSAAGTLGASGLSGRFVNDVDDNSPLIVNEGIRRAENTIASTGSSVFWGRQRGTLATPAIVQAGDTMYNLDGYGYDGVDYATSTEIRSMVEGTPASNKLPGVLTFSTADNSTGNMGERLRIDSLGRIGIASTSPTYSLSVGNTFSVASTTGEVIAQDHNTAYQGALSSLHRLVLSTASTTTWTASTTGAYIPFVVAPFAGTIRNASCSTDASFLGVNIYVGASTSVTPSYFVASTTVGTETFTATNTFTAGQLISMAVGTTTTASATKITCTLGITETP